MYIHQLLSRRGMGLFRQPIKVTEFRIFRVFFCRFELQYPRVWGGGMFGFEMIIIFWQKTTFF